MKRLIPLIGIIAAFALSACDKEENIEVAINPVGCTVEFTAGAPTKTIFGTPSGNVVPVLWTSTYPVALSLNFGAPQESSLPVVGDDRQTASFKASLSDDHTGHYVIYAVSPGVACKEFNAATRSSILDIPDIQRPLETSVDEEAMVILSSCDNGESFPEQVHLQFSHFTAYGKITFAGLQLENGETVSSVCMTASEKWVGRYEYVWEENSRGDSAGTVIEQSAGYGLTLYTNQISDLWFACAPVDMGGKTIDVVVTTDRGHSFSKTITIPEGKKFEAGKVASFTISMTGIEPESPLSDEYIPITTGNVIFSDYDSSTGTLTIEPLVDNINIKVGNVFVYTNENYASIRVVTDVRYEGGKYYLTTEDGAMDDIFKNCSFTLSTSGKSRQSRSHTNVFMAKRISSSGSDNEFNYNNRFIGPKDKGNKVLWENNENVLQASYEFESSFDMEITFNFNNTLGLNPLSSFDTTISGEADFTYELSLEGSFAIGDKGEETLVENVIRPVGAMFQPFGVPVYISFSTDLICGYDLSMEGDYTLSYGGGFKAEMEYGIHYSKEDGLSAGVEKIDYSADAPHPSFSGSVSLEAKASLFPRIKMFMYNGIGPVFDIKPYLRATVEGSTDIENLMDMNVDNACLLVDESCGLDVNTKLHLNPFSKKTDSDLSTGDYNVFEQLLYQAPSSLHIESQIYPFGAGEDQYGIFCHVFEKYYDISDREMKEQVCTLPIPVLAKKWGQEGKQIIIPDMWNEAIYPVAEEEINDIAVTFSITTGAEGGPLALPNVASYFNVKKTRDALTNFFLSTNGYSWTRPWHWLETGNMISTNAYRGWEGLTSPGDEEALWLELRSVGLAGELEFVDCPYVSDLDLSELGAELAGYYAANNLYGNGIIRDCPDLETVDLSGNYLTSLSIAGCPKINRIYLQNMPGLKTVEIYWPHSITSRNDIQYSGTYWIDLDGQHHDPVIVVYNEYGEAEELRY